MMALFRAPADQSSSCWNHFSSTATRYASRALAMRYGVVRRPISLIRWLIAIAAVLTGAVAVAGGAGLGGVLGVVSWALVLVLATWRVQRLRLVIVSALLAVSAAVLLPWWAVLPEVFASPDSMAWVLLHSLFVYGGAIPVITTLVVIYLWCVRAERIR